MKPRTDTTASLRILGIAVIVIGLSALCMDIRMRSVLSKKVENGGKSSTFDAISAPTANSQDEPKAMLTRSLAKCLTFEKTFDDLVASSNNVFITMPAKAAGTTMKAFAIECAGTFGGDNILNAPREIERAFKSTGAEPFPSIIASHIQNDISFINLVKNIPRQSLVLYIYRDETDRLVSAIKEVIVTRTCMKSKPKSITLDGTQFNGSRCVVNEKEVIQKVIQSKIMELKFGATEIMTCKFYDAIQENFPQLVFVHYKQADRIQKVLAKYHCPNLLDNPVHENIGGEKKIETFLKLDSTGEEIALEDWLEVKQDMLAFTFKLDKMQTCKAKTLSMQDDLLGCEDEMLQVTRDTSF